MAERMKKMVNSFLANLPKQESRVAAHVKADLLLINCIDCRYPHAIHKYMQHDHAGKVYDHLVLAGASLAGVEKYTHLDY